MNRLGGTIPSRMSPEHTAADSSGDAKNHHSQQIQTLFDGYQGTGGRKGHGTDYFDDKKD